MQCACGDLKNQQPQSIMLSQAGGGAVTVPNPSASSSSSSQSITTIQAVVSQLPPPQVETKKGQPGSTPTFPNGLRDVHEMAAAAQALGGLSDTGNQAAERKREHMTILVNIFPTADTMRFSPKSPQPVQLCHDWRLQVLWTQAGSGLPSQAQETLCTRYGDT